RTAAPWTTRTCCTSWTGSSASPRRPGAGSRRTRARRSGCWATGTSRPPTRTCGRWSSTRAGRTPVPRSGRRSGRSSTPATPTSPGRTPRGRGSTPTGTTPSCGSRGTAGCGSTSPSAPRRCRPASSTRSSTGRSARARARPTTPRSWWTCADRTTPAPPGTGPARPAPRVLGVGYNAIDPDGVIAMSAATLAAFLSVGTIGEEIRKQTDKVDHLVPGAPDAEGRARTEAAVLAEIAGFARSRAVRYVDDVKPLKDLLEMGYWLPDFSNLGWDGERTALENVDRMARSDEAGAFVLGTAGALL